MIAVPNPVWFKSCQQWLTTPQWNWRSRPYRFWWAASLLVALFYALLALKQAVSDPLVVQDDARQFVFWMQRWQDPTLFPNDWIADYFESVTPLGIKGLYGLAIALGIPPFTANIGLPLILGLITTHYLFRLTMVILPVPFTAWMACILLNQTLWMKDDLVSATPRAFVYPCFLAFMFYWSQFQQRREHWTQIIATNPSLTQRDSSNASMGRHFIRTPVGKTQNRIFEGVPRFARDTLKNSWSSQPGFSISRNGLALSIGNCALSLGLLGLFYPQYILVAVGMLLIALIGDISIQRRGNVKGQLKHNRPIAFGHHWQQLFYVITLTTAAVVIGFYALTTSAYGPVVTLQQARTMAEFWPGGRTFFFSDNFWWFYGVGDRSGFFHVGLVRPATLSLGIFLPLLLRWQHHFPLVKAITPRIHQLSQFLLAASLVFTSAHLALFRLHLPSRYTDHSLRIILAIATALTLTLLLNRLFTNSPTHSPLPPLTPAISILLTLTLLLAYPLWVKPFPLTKYKIGQTPQIYTYLQTQPVDTVVASTAKAADNIPIFAQRSILVGHEYAIPYHTGYYDEFRKRAIALLNAQYSRDPDELIRFIQDYHITFWVLEKNAYEPDFLQHHWTQQYLSDPDLTIDTDSPDMGINLSRSQRDRPILQQWQPRCTVVTEADVHLIDTQCLIGRNK